MVAALARSRILHEERRVSPESHPLISPAVSNPTDAIPNRGSVLGMNRGIQSVVLPTTIED
jgi:hypothetical protein